MIRLFTRFFRHSAAIVFYAVAKVRHAYYYSADMPPLLLLFMPLRYFAMLMLSLYIHAATLLDVA